MQDSERPMDRVCEEVRQVIEREVQPVVKRFKMKIVVSEHSASVVEVAAKNKKSFLVVTWSQRDGLEYHIGPTVIDRIPDLFFTGSPSPEYRIHHFAMLKNKKPPTPIYGWDGVHTLDVSLANAVAFVLAEAAEFLEGDWSRRDKLEETVRVHRRERGL